MEEISKVLQSNPALLDLFSTAVICDEEQIKTATIVLNKLKRKNDVDGFILTCKDHLIPFYESCGFKFVKVSASTHGNAKWNDMVIDCRGEI